MAHSCLRRSWLLAELGAVLDYNCRAWTGGLLEPAGGLARTSSCCGRSPAAGAASWKERYGGASAWPRASRAVARQSKSSAGTTHGYPEPPAAAPRRRPMLHVAGGIERLQRPRRAAARRNPRYGSSSYRLTGREMARSPLRAGTGRERVGDRRPSCANGIAPRLGRRGRTGRRPAATLTVLQGGPRTWQLPSRGRSLYERLTHGGLRDRRAALWHNGSALGVPRRPSARLARAPRRPGRSSSRGRGQPARAGPGARIARSLGRTIAAVPGRVTFAGLPAAVHVLLQEGSAPDPRGRVTCSSCSSTSSGRRRCRRCRAGPRSAGLEPRLQRMPREGRWPAWTHPGQADRRARRSRRAAAGRSASWRLLGPAGARRRRSLCSRVRRSPAGEGPRAARCRLSARPPPTRSRSMLPSGSARSFQIIDELTSEARARDE